MARKYFGTDGIRGRTNESPMTAEIAMKVGQAAGAHFQRGDHRHRVVIGKDTRLSGYMMESALVAGFTSVGMDVVMVGPMPTPAVAMLTRSMRADLGVMISASHNPFADNGIKLFGPDGYKLSDDDEALIEKALEEPVRLVPSADIGRARRVEDARGRYVHAVKSSFPEHLRLDGLRVVLDCANGAAYEVAPSALWELGADVIAIGVTPNGININDKVGSTDARALQAKVNETRADIGIALDGDADRLIVVDNHGRVIDGDQLMALIAKGTFDRGELRGGGIVATVMSNLGLERFLATMASASTARRSATAMSSRRCAPRASMSAANSRGTSSCPTMPPPATGWSRRCRCSPNWSRAAGPRASCSICSIRCPNCSRMSASPAASRSRTTRSRQRSPMPRRSSTAMAGW
jgi:phosphoglucosamine mutase